MGDQRAPRPLAGEISLRPETELARTPFILNPGIGGNQIRDWPITVVDDHELTPFIVLAEKIVDRARDEIPPIRGRHDA
jgi:hypothetical protein